MEEICTCHMIAGNGIDVQKISGTCLQMHSSYKHTQPTSTCSLCPEAVPS